MKKNDFILIVIVLAVAAAFFAWNTGKARKGGDRVVITVDGEKYGTYPLYEDNEIEINSENGFNKLIIAGGKAHMETADCPDKYCVDKGEIGRNGETLICLPHKVVVEIQADGQAVETEEGSVDAVAR